ncbi:DEAD/DEAH box helicase [Donghicola sp.]|uniref:DEAD/DEAH box helicase n=1 Tax=Donghicola sp. TaxID=1929294 RepID=UPI0025F7F854|nr:DEAD/DEAH box helicase [Donghicola sp.]MCT4575756.1 DEAD/DEAH box helicase [Donghicola sp.]
MKNTLAQALERRGYSSLTPVQEAVSNPELGTQDMLVSAQTGSGKTVGFGLAIANAILGDADTFGAAEAPLALIIAPTRELALQVKRELVWLYEDAGAFLASCVGGMDFRDEKRALARGAHIVVATPGRLRDHIQRDTIDLSNVRAVVLDEADEMLDLGFSEDLEFILGSCPEERQTLLFSATVPKEIERMAKKYQRDALRISTVSEQKQHSDIEYRAMVVNDRDSENAIINVLRYYEAPNAIIFANTRAMVARMTSRLSNRGFSVVALSGELTQTERTHALQAMRDGRARVCVATDVAARGIDLPNLELVIHAELPSNHETLLHRSGRTGRAGRKGVSSLMVTPKNRKKAERLLKWAKLNATWGSAPSAEEVAAKDSERMLADESWQDTPTSTEQPTVDLLTQTFSVEQLALAYLRALNTGRSAPEEIDQMSVDAPAPRKQREEFTESVWFQMDAGHNQNVTPRWMLPMICRAGDITKDEIGAMRILDTVSYIELRADAVAGFLDEIGASMTTDRGYVLKQLDEAPKLSKPQPRSKSNRKFAEKNDRPFKRKREDEDRPRPASEERAPRPAGDRPERSERPAPRPAEAHGPVARKTKPVWGDKPAGDKPKSDKPRWDKTKREDRDDRPRAPRSDDRPGKPGGKPAGRKFGDDRGGKPSGKRPFNKDGKSGFGKDDRKGGKPDGAKRGFGAKPGRPAGKGGDATPFRKPAKGGKPGKPGGAYSKRP